MTRTTRRTSPFGATGTSVARVNFANVDDSSLEPALADVTEIEEANVSGEGR